MFVVGAGGGGVPVPFPGRVLDGPDGPSLVHALVRSPNIMGHVQFSLLRNALCLRMYVCVGINVRVHIRSLFACACGRGVVCLFTCLKKIVCTKVLI